MKYITAINLIKKKICFFIPFFFGITINLHAQSCDKAFHIVVLGSSTAYGTGASNQSKAWVYLYKDFLQKINSKYIVDDLAIPGTTTYSAQPDSFISPANRPQTISGHNISTAIKLKADAVILNFPSNDAVQNFSLQEQKDNFKRITDTAKKHNIQVWVATPQPRNNLNAAQVESQHKLYDWINKYYKENAVDFHTGIASAKDSILFKFNSGDGIHLNNIGHNKLYNRVLNELIPDILCSLQKSNIKLQQQESNAQKPLSREY